MTFEKTRDVLDKVREFHRGLSEFYARMSEIAQKEKVKMLLDYMSRHEEHLEQCLSRYQTDGAKRLLDTWFKNTPPILKHEFFRKAKLTPDMSVKDVVKAAIQFDNCIAEFYMQMAELSHTDEIRHLFRCLLEMEKEEERQAIRSALDL